MSDHSAFSVVFRRSNREFDHFVHTENKIHVIYKFHTVKYLANLFLIIVLVDQRSLICIEYNYLLPND